MVHVLTLLDLIDGYFVAWQVREAGGVTFTQPCLPHWNRVDILLCHLKRRCPLGARKSERNGALSFAEKLLVRKKEVEGSSVVASDAELEQLAPHVCQLLTTKIKDEKKVIDPASLTVFCRTGSWHVCLKSKGLELGWWGEGPTLKGALQALEVAVTKEDGQEAPR